MLEIFMIVMAVVTVWWLIRGRAFLRAVCAPAAAGQRVEPAPAAPAPADWVSEARMWHQLNEMLDPSPPGPPVIPGRE